MSQTIRPRHRAPHRCTLEHDAHTWHLPNGVCMGPKSPPWHVYVRPHWKKCVKRGEIDLSIMHSSNLTNEPIT